MSTAVLAPPGPPATAAPPGLPDLILLRLLPAKGSVPPKKLRDDLAVFFSRPPAANDVSAAVAALRAEGYIAARGQQATAAGRARAMQFLGADKLPPRANWGTVKAKFLVPLALRVAPDAPAANDRDKLAALLLKRALALPVGTGETLNAVLEAIACRALGFRGHTTLKSLQPVLLARAMDTHEPPAPEDAPRIVPQVLLRAKTGDLSGLRAVALGGWADGMTVGATVNEPGVPEAAEEPFDLELFANTVRAVARTCPTGRFGDNKVFISHVWEQLRDEPRFRSLGLEGFKARLIEANRARRLTLSRADLVQHMNPADVRASETAYLNATFHFILIEGS